MKKLLALAVFFAISAYPDPQVSRTVTFTTGTAVRISNNDVQANSIFVQMLHGGTALGYVLFAAPDVTCALATAGQLVAEMAPATATAPGGTFNFPSNSTAQSGSSGTNVHFWCVGGTTGDTAVISYNVRN